MKSRSCPRGWRTRSGGSRTMLASSGWCSTRRRGSPSRPQWTTPLPPRYCVTICLLILTILVSVSDPGVPPGIRGQVRGQGPGPHQRDDLPPGPVRQSRGPRGPGPAVPDDCAAEEWPHQGGLRAVTQWRIVNCHSMWLCLSLDEDN